MVRAARCRVVRHATTTRPGIVSARCCPLDRALSRASRGVIGSRLLDAHERTPVIMKKTLALGATLLLLGALALAACGKTPGGTSTSTSGSPTISMDANNFTAHSLTVKVNQDVKLDDTVSGGGYHVLCFGSGNG